MPENKTQPTDASVSDYIASRASDEQRTDCAVLMTMFQRLTGEPPTMWGPSIVGHGRYRYTYDSGRSGEACLAAFAIRGRELVVYLSCDGHDQQALLARVGKHKMGKSCFYFKRLADLDTAVLEQLVAGSIAEVRRKYG
ncbi:DUF1801 domain-containing protein [Ideonella sp.]|uniref:DUF1801 domain-containing protein n=1 Tax=Ideonella sp. TaxID=1929293 RepID=UPI0035B3ACEF